MYRLIFLVAVLATASTAYSQPPKQPQTPAPSYTVAWITPQMRKSGDLLLSYTMTIHHVETRERIVEKDGKKVRVKEKVRVPVLYRKYRKKKIAGLIFTNAVGEKQTPEDVRDELAKPKIVLISSDGKKVDPYYLKIVKPDTLVIVDPSVKPAAAK